MGQSRSGRIQGLGMFRLGEPPARGAHHPGCGWDPHHHIKAQPGSLRAGENAQETSPLCLLPEFHVDLGGWRSLEHKKEVETEWVTVTSGFSEPQLPFRRVQGRLEVDEQSWELFPAPPLTTLFSSSGVVGSRLTNGKRHLSFQRSNCTAN